MTYTATAGAGITLLEPPAPPPEDAIEVAPLEEDIVDAEIVEETTSNIVPFQKPEPPAVVEHQSVSQEFHIQEDEVVQVEGVAMVTMDAFERFRQQMSDTFHATVADVERRLHQTRVESLRNLTGQLGQVFVEDINDGKHRITGYLLENNAPTTGSIRWSSLHVVFMNVDYTIADGNTANTYVWFVKPASGTTATLQTGNTLPVLGPNDALLFVNRGGVAVSQTEASLPAAVQPGSITSDMLSSALAGVLSLLRTDIDNAQATADGNIVSYFQNDPPWANGSVQPASTTGDIWYDANDGGAFRWSGPSGSPANTWVRIADTDTSALAALVNTKITTYVSATAPAAPAGGFSTGDFWIDTANGNVTKRWSGSAWVAYQLGDAALSGISGAKVGTGINASNVTNGTLAAARVGAGVNGAILTTATGQVGQTQIGPGAVANSNLANGAVQPKNINASFHILY